MENKLRKQYLSLDAQPILTHTLRAFESAAVISEIFLVVPPEDFAYCRRHVVSLLKSPDKIRLVPGGHERQDSVFNGLMAAGNSGKIAVIHDGIRPFIGSEQIAACVQGSKETGACILGIPAFDTVKQVGSAGFVEKTLKRETLWLAQTPQAFSYEIILQAHENAIRKGLRGTDDALLVEKSGGKVKMIMGSRFNIKITTPQDLIMAEVIFKTFRRADREKGADIP